MITDYRQRITDPLSKINSPRLLKRIYNYLKVIYTLDEDEE